MGSIHRSARPSTGVDPQRYFEEAWPEIAAGAWLGYTTVGRGILLFREDSCDAVFLRAADLQDAPQMLALVNRYNPETDAAIAFLIDGRVTGHLVTTAGASLTPKAAYEARRASAN